MVSGLGWNASSSGFETGAGQSGGVTRRTGAFKWCHPFSAAIAATSAETPQRAQLVSATTRRPVFRSERRMISSSSGRTLRRSMTSALTPCWTRISAARAAS